MKTACLGLRSVRNYATPFHNFYKIVPLRSVPHNQAKPTANPLPQAEKTKNISQKALLELQRYKQSKANPRWGIYSNFERNSPT